MVDKSISGSLVAIVSFAICWTLTLQILQVAIRMVIKSTFIVASVGLYKVCILCKINMSQAVVVQCLADDNSELRLEVNFV